MKQEEADVRDVVMIMDDPLRPMLPGQAIPWAPPPLGPGAFNAPLPRAHRAPPPLTREQRKAKRATRKAERQHRKTGRRGGR